MFRLTREVRFALNPDAGVSGPGLVGGEPINGFGGYPAPAGIVPFLALRVTLEGSLDPASNYVRNIIEIDRVVRQVAIPIVSAHAAVGRDPRSLIRRLFDDLSGRFPGATLHELSLALTPFLRYSCLQRENPMVRLSQKFEFSAAHRLHNPVLSDEENRRCFGKCNNPRGHGHNYELEVTIRGAEAGSAPTELPSLQRIVNATVIERFDHRHLNLEVPPFDTVIPSVENIARVIFDLLKPALAAGQIELDSVTVWETPKTWCRYSDKRSD